MPCIRLQTIQTEDQVQKFISVSIDSKNVVCLMCDNMFFIYVGFLQSYNEVKGSLVSIVLDQLKKYPSYKVAVTG